MINKTYIKCDMDKIYTENDNVGRPMYPSQWRGDAVYVPVIRIEMTAGGGLGGRSWSEIIKDVTLEDLQKKKTIIADTWDGQRILLNLDYMVKAEPATLMVRVFNSDNHNYATGIYTYYRLIPENTKVVFKP